jgi:hypothetical protein
MTKKAPATKKFTTNKKQFTYKLAGKGFFEDERTYAYNKASQLRDIGLHAKVSKIDNKYYVYYR